MRKSTTVEVMIRDVVYDAALARARAQAQQLRGVAREILWDRAAQAEPNEHAVMPAARFIDAPRRRLRFQAPRDAYQKALGRLHASGVSVTAAIEEGLEQFARTGEFK